MKYSTNINTSESDKKLSLKNKVLRDIKFSVPEISILAKHGRQFVPNLKTAEIYGNFRGRPEIRKDISDNEKQILIEMCPTNAFQKDDFCLNLAKCVFCKECEFAFPNKIKFTKDYKIATNDIENLKIYPGESKPIEFNDKIRRKEVKKLFRKSLKLRQVSAGGDNSCEMELNAAGNVNFDMGRYGIDFMASPRHADGMVITGPITENMSAALEITWNAIPSPKICILAGTDAISGGIFAESKAIKRDFLEKYNIDLYVPGNPCHPLTFINGILNLIEK